MSGRKPLIAGNWKMHKTIEEARELVSHLKRELSDLSEVDIVVCPSFTALENVGKLILGTNIKLGAQDVFYIKEGAFTGEVSSPQLKDCGCDYVIVGHSERRKYFQESNEMINKKIKASLEEGLNPILCVGETLEEREANQTIEVVTNQLEGGLSGIEENQLLKLTIAYEPVWAIGTGKTATPQQAEEVQKFIREWIEKKYSARSASSLRILYGGSVKPNNIKDLMREEDIDGALVGGASLDASSFIAIVKGAL